MGGLGGKPTASLRLASSFRLILLPQRCQPTTAATARMMPARQPPTIEATGIVTLLVSSTGWGLEVADGENIVVVTTESGDGDGEDIEGSQPGGCWLPVRLINEWQADT